VNQEILRALDLPVDATDAQIAEGLRKLAGLPPHGTTDDALWMRFVDGIELARHGAGGARADLALLANRIVEHAIVPPEDPGEERYGTRAWDRELGVPYPESDERLRKFVIDVIAPRLWDAGLFYIVNYA
jgi:hypothetical protein